MPNEQYLQKQNGEAKEPRLDPEHVRLLLTGEVEAWNKWRMKNHEIINLDEISLNGVNLRGADLTRVSLKGADMVGANLEGAILNGANLRGASLFRAKLNGADLTEANLEGANLLWAELIEAKLDHANLREADFKEANLRGVSLFGATLNGADLTGANLEGVDFDHVHLKGAKFNQANLKGADLRTASDLLLDSTFTREAQFAIRAKDRWSQLRRSYTGPRMIFTLLFLVVFFLPYFVKGSAYIVANKVQYQIGSMVSRLEAIASKTEKSDEQLAVVLRSISEGLRSQVPWAESPKWKVSSVWRLVLGFEREWTYWATALALVLFNILRALLTFIVAPMRDAEERSGWSPALIPRAVKGRGLSGKGFRENSSLLEAYGWLWWPHIAVKTLWWLSVGSFMYHAWYWLTLPVWIQA